jgi:hypothetical protein
MYVQFYCVFVGLGGFEGNQFFGFECLCSRESETQGKQFKSVLRGCVCDSVVMSVSVIVKGGRNYMKQHTWRVEYP